MTLNIYARSGEKQIRFCSGRNILKIQLRYRHTARDGDDGTHTSHSLGLYSLQVLQ